MSTYCEVSLNAALSVRQDDCEAPPNCEEATVRTRCYRCGQRACKACSWVDFDPWPGRKTRRCRDCRHSEREASCL